jgi:hypothetical protein
MTTLVLLLLGYHVLFTPSFLYRPFTAGVRSFLVTFFKIYNLP